MRNKFLICGAMLLPIGIACADEKPSATVSGFADIIYMMSDESADAPVGGHVAGNPNGCTVGSTKNCTEGKFTADGEVDVMATVGKVTARIDIDVSLAPLTPTDDSASIEQAFFAWQLQDNVTLIGGVINNPIGYEANDAPDMDFTSHGLVYDVLNGQTALDGSNIAGVAAVVDLGEVTVTGALLNDLQQVDEENSLALLANASPMEGLDLELGFVTQADNKDNPNSAEDVVDFNAKYTFASFVAGIDYLTAGKIVDSVYDIWGVYQISDALAVKARLSTISYEAAGVKDTDATTLYGSWQANDNLLIALEWRNDDNGSTDTDKITAEFIATF